MVLFPPAFLCLLLRLSASPIQVGAIQEISHLKSLNTAASHAKSTIQANEPDIFDSVPDEVFRQIHGHLDNHELAQFGSTTKVFRAALKPATDQRKIIEATKAIESKKIYGKNKALYEFALREMPSKVSHISEEEQVASVFEKYQSNLIPIEELTGWLNSDLRQGIYDYDYVDFEPIWLMLNDLMTAKTDFNVMPSNLMDLGGFLILGSGNGHLALVQKLISEHRINPNIENNEPFIIAVQKNQKEIVKYLLNDGRIDPGDQDNFALAIAIKNGDYEVVEILLHDNRIDPTYVPILWSVLEDTVEKYKIFQLLLSDPRVDPGLNENEAIKSAAEDGYVQIFEDLLNDIRVDPTANNNEALRLAVINGKTEVVKLLLNDGRVDPTANNNEAIRVASENGHTEIVELLEFYRPKKRPRLE